MVFPVELVRERLYASVDFVSSSISGTVSPVHLKPDVLTLRLPMSVGTLPLCLRVASTLVFDAIIVGANFSVNIVF